MRRPEHIQFPDYNEPISQLPVTLEVGAHGLEWRLARSVLRPFGSGNDTRVIKV